MGRLYAYNLAATAVRFRVSPGQIQCRKSSTGTGNRNLVTGVTNAK
jgi:hypothetical protein